MSNFNKLPPISPNKINDIDYFVISMPNCGSTSLYNALRRIAPDSVLGFHSDFTLLRLHGDENITTESLLNARALIDRPYYIFLPFREPISRKISQYYQYGKSHRKSIETIKEEIREFCLGNFSLFNSLGRTEVDEEISYTSIYQDTSLPVFNKTLGYIHTVDGNRNVIRYTLLNIKNLEKYLQEILSQEFNILVEKKSEDKNGYFEVRETIKFSEEELNKIYNKFGSYYYTEDQINKFKEKYR